MYIDGILIRPTGHPFKAHINVECNNPPPDINSFLDTILNVAKQTIPLTRPPVPGKNAPWWDNNCQRAVALRRRAMRAFICCICDAHEEEARKARFDAQQIILQAKKLSWQTFSNTFNRFTPLSKMWCIITCFNKNGNRNS